MVSAPSEGAIAQRIADWQRSHGRLPDPAQREALIQAALDEDILFREALRLGLHRRDPVVLRRLYQDVQFLGLEAAPADAIRTALDMQLYTGDEVIRRRLLERMRAIGHGPAPPLDEAALRQRYQDQLARWSIPPRLSFEHRFLRDADSARPQELLRRLRDGEEVSADPFLLGQRFTALDRSEVAERFGQSFAERLWAQTDGLWSGPLRSPYGQHLVRISDRLPQQPRPYAEVRERLAQEWREALQAERLRAWIAQLRRRYRVLPS